VANKITTLLDWKEEGGGIKKISANIREAEGWTGKLKAGIGGVASEFRKSNTAQAAALGGAAALAGKAISAASDLAESVNAVNVSYGDAAESVLALGENSAESFGMAKSEFNAFAVQFSSFAKNISAETGQPVAAVLDDLTTRVADFASVMNLDLNEAASVFMSTMSGETEPIRRFGKDVSAAAVELYALKNGLIDNKAELTESIKVQARYGLLMEQTKDTAGDFANTSDGLANKQRILKAQFKDMQAAIGEDLMPALVSLTTGLQNLLEISEKLHLDDALDTSWAEGLGTKLGHVFSPWNTGARQASEAAQKFAKDGQKAFNDLDPAIIKNAESVASLRAKVIDLTGNEHAANLAAVEWAGAQEDVVEVVEEATNVTGSYTDKLDAMKAAYDPATAAARLNEEATAAKAEADKEAAEAADRHRAAVEAVADAMERQQDIALELVGGDIAVRDAQNDAARAAEELNDVLAEQEDGLRGAGEAIDAAASAQLHAASAATEYKIKQLEANGQSVDAEAKASMFKAELERLAGTLDGPLLAAIQRYIDQLNLIPASKNTVISVSGGGKVFSGDGPVQSSQPGVVGASGGIVNHPTMALIGEAGPEAVIPLSHSPGNSPLPAGLGGSTFNITVNAGGGASGQLIGQQIVNEIKKWERQNGAGWRQ
jgi:hypothetical protein